jgi:hypothetical protein
MSSYPSPLVMHGFCMEHQVICCTSGAATDEIWRAPYLGAWPRFIPLEVRLFLPLSRQLPLGGLYQLHRASLGLDLLEQRLKLHLTLRKLGLHPPQLAQCIEHFGGLNHNTVAYSKDAPILVIHHAAIYNTYNNTPSADELKAQHATTTMMQTRCSDVHLPIQECLVVQRATPILQRSQKIGRTDLASTGLWLGASCCRMLGASSSRTLSAEYNVRTVVSNPLQEGVQHGTSCLSLRYVRDLYRYPRPQYAKLRPDKAPALPHKPPEPPEREREREQRSP